MPQIKRNTVYFNADRPLNPRTWGQVYLDLKTARQYSDLFM